MSQRGKLAKEMNVIEKEIQFLEIKRSRSMAALIEALISRTAPNDADVQYFRTFTYQTARSFGITEIQHKNGGNAVFCLSFGQNCAEFRLTNGAGLW